MTNEFIFWISIIQIFITGFYFGFRLGERKMINSTEELFDLVADEITDLEYEVFSLLLQEISEENIILRLSIDKETYDICIDNVRAKMNEIEAIYEEN